MKEAAEKSNPVTPGTKAPDEKKTLIAALKRCATAIEGSPSARASVAQNRHSKLQFSSNAGAWS